MVRDLLLTVRRRYRRAETAEVDRVRTQRVTAVDLSHGRIRLPHAAKAPFPAVQGLVRILLRGVPLEVAYDPRLGPDRERSAVISVGRDTLGVLVGENEVLEVRPLPDGSIELS